MDDNQNQNLNQPQIQEPSQQEENQPIAKFEAQQMQNQTVLNANILKHILIIQIIVAVTFLYVTIFLQVLCMIQNICGMSGIEVNVTFQESLIAFYICTLLMIYLVYQSVVNIQPRQVFILKWPLLLYSIVVIIFAVVAFIFQSTYQLSDIQNKWDVMTSLSKEWYDNDINNLLDQNTHNFLLIGVYHLITGILLICLFMCLFNFQYIMPSVWRPAPTLRATFLNNNLIFKDSKVKQQQLIEDNKDDEIKDDPFGQKQEEQVPQSGIESLQQAERRPRKFKSKQVEKQEEEEQPIQGGDHEGKPFP